MRFAARTACLAAFAALASTPLGAQDGVAVLEPAPAGAAAPDRPARSLAFTLGAGVIAEPGYFGSDGLVVGPAGSLSGFHLSRNGREFGTADPDAPDIGFDFGGSLRVIGERSAALYPELTGLADIDLAVELGGGVSYAQPAWEVFANLRYGIGGHSSAVGEVGMDLIARPLNDLTLTAGPRFFLGSDDYAATYFGVTPSEAATSGLAAFEAQGGLLSAGVTLGANYDLGGPWGLNGAVSWERFQGDAAASPIVRQGTEESFSAGIVATRRFSLEF